MPVERVAVVHKFGIISHSQRLALEDRLARKSLPPPPTFLRSRRPALEVTEEFIAKFNDSNISDEDQMELKDLAKKMLIRSKRRAGIRDGGTGEHVDLPKAWAELTLLAQCNDNKIREESLAVLISSLDQAPITKDLIPSLFYLGKSCLHWLKKKSIDQPYLRTGEMQLIQMGHLVFTRLYFHLLANELQEYQEDKDSLLQYMAGIADREDIYKSFPGALLSIRFITEVGYLICTQGDENPGKHDIETAQALDSANQTSSEAAEPGNNPAQADVEQSENSKNQLEFSKASRLQGSPVPSTIHDVSPTLWHALDVWRSTYHRGTGLQQALHGLSLCGTGLATESWLDISIAFRVLSEAAKQEQSVLQTLQNLGAGILTKPAALTEIHAHHLDLCDQCLSRMAESNLPVHDKNRNPAGRATDSIARGHVSTASPILAAKTPSFVRGIKHFASLGINDKPEIDKHSDDSEVIRSRSDRGDTSSEASFADVSSVDSVEDETRKKSPLTKRERESRSNLRSAVSHGDFSSDSENETDGAEVKSASYGVRTTMSAPEDQRRTSPSTRRSRTGTGVRFSFDNPLVAQVSMEPHSGAPSAATERTLTKDSLYSGQTASSVTLPVAVEGSSREASMVRTDTALFPEGIGILGWRWELAYSYAECMATVCLYGTTSTIQKSALLGTETRPKKLMYAGKVTGGKSSLGLVGLLNLKYADKEVETVNRDWSWRVRFAAVQGLVRVCRHCHGDSNKEGIRTVAWGALLKHHSVERDVRVLEALKVANVEADLESARCPRGADDLSLLSCRLASRLSAALLPPLPGPVPAPPAHSRSRVERIPINKPIPRREPKRPSLRQEILIANATHESPVDYATRMNHQLLAVIDDQWKKELHEMEEEEDKERRVQADQNIKELVDIENKKAQENETRKEKRAQAQALRSTRQNQAAVQNSKA